MADKSDRPARVTVSTSNYRWTIRGVDPQLVRTLRVRAIQQDRQLAMLLNEALRAYLDAEAAA